MIQGNHYEFDEFGFVSREFFRRSFKEQAKYYLELVKSDIGHAVFRKPEPSVELVLCPTASQADLALALSAEYSAQIIHDPINDYGQMVLDGLSIPAGMEMIGFTFLIKGCSRVFTHQQVRHRLASISQSNSRDRIIPPVFVLPYEEPKQVEVASERCIESYIPYLYSILDGNEPQDARYLLTDCTVQAMVFEIDFKALQALCNQRLCMNMQPETSFVSWRMKEEVERVLGKKFSNFLRPTCDRIKACLPIQCGVYDGCGKWPISHTSKTGKIPMSQTSQGYWKQIREKFFAER